MKKVMTIAVLFSLIYSTNTFAGGSKGGDPLKYPQVFSFDGGSKGGDPIKTDTGSILADEGGSKGGDPERGGSKGGDPERQAMTMDSGYPTLSALLSKYFSI